MKNEDKIVNSFARVKTDMNRLNTKLTAMGVVTVLALSTVAAMFFLIISAM